MPLDLEAKQDESIDAQQDVDPASPAATDTGDWATASISMAFIQKFRALLDASSRCGVDLSRDEFDMLRREYVALGGMDRYAVQSALSGSYSYFAGFDSDDYDGFVDAQ